MVREFSANELPSSLDSRFVDSNQNARILVTCQ
jgi:hypothetical protein